MIQGLKGLDLEDYDLVFRLGGGPVLYGLRPKTLNP